jgi:16S rRNA (guanine527-N7)-methyltransferase
MQAANRELLMRGLAALGLDPPERALDALVGYHDLLMEANRALNLTGHRDERVSVVRNLLNALAPWPHIDASRATADVGAGGGLPGVPLAIVLGVPMTLVESKAKKARFLRQACARTAPRVDVLHSDAAAVRQPFAQVVSSALGTLARVITLTGGMRAPGCRLLVYKGRREVIDSEISQCPPGMRGWRVEAFEVPCLEKGAARHLCILELA